MPPGQIDAALLEQIKERTPLVDLVGRTVPLKRSGRMHVGCCPFHGEKTASFTVQSDHYHCFGCGAHGDAIKFVQQINRLSFPEAVRDLAQQAGLEVPGTARPLTAAERERREKESSAARERDAERQRRQEADRQLDHEVIRKMANRVWDQAGPADPNHPYLVRKGLAGDTEGLKQDRWGNLLAPCRDISGQLWNIERILPEKTKRGKDKFTLSRKVDGEPRGGRVDSVITVFGDIDAEGPLAISTGRAATAKSVRRATGWTTVAVGSDSNLLAVSQALRERFPNREIIIAGDNDIRLESRVDARGVPMENQGRIKAEAAAKAVSAVAAIPPFPTGSNDSDWNDYERLHGSTAAGDLLEAARKSFDLKMENHLMPDASGSPEAVVIERQDWRPVVEALQSAYDSKTLQDSRPELAERTEKLLNDIREGADVQDELVRTRIAYLVSDIDRTTHGSLPMPPELRSEVDHRAVSYPGLDHPDIQDLLRQTASMVAGDYQTIRDVRMLARDHVNHDPAKDPEGTSKVTAERIAALEDRVRNALAGPEAPPHTEVSQPAALPSAEPPMEPQRPEPAADAGPQPQAAQAQTQARQQMNQAQARQGAPQAGRQDHAQQQQAQVQQSGTVNIPVSAASRILNRLVQRGAGDGPPPWQGVTQALSNRIAPYHQAQLDRFHRDLERSVGASGKAAVKALASLETGPAADVMRKIKQEASRDPNGATGVIEQMRPGGKHETLRNEFNAVFAQHGGFGKEFDRAKVALTNFLQGRNSLEENYRRRGWRVEDLDEKLKNTDQAIANAAERIPGRESGKSMSEELAKKAMELAEALCEKVRQTFSRIQSAVSPEATPAGQPAPSMSPSP